MKTLQEIATDKIRHFIFNNKIPFSDLDNLTEVCKNLVENRIEKYDREHLDYEMLDIINISIYYKSTNFPNKYVFKEKSFQITPWNKKYISKHQLQYNSQMSLYFNNNLYGN
tara:strand:+ start:221 stop:556 length:336 start_codon:yes stop_codon:yes gene_type:complete